jgi:hypothetical protein
VPDVRPLDGLLPAPIPEVVRNLALVPDEDATSWAPDLVQHNLTRLKVVFEPHG